ncbi:GNAT family N-acetyltransferase [Gracilibacillus sp. YIM 98692]|uniref:GNAT family N-acetyltransferase n=1 Tax=Gracilibacillus sp. YIM 98692 TaxID=2663532 RepID=UPI0013D4E711|nr:GNAT family N-acetyltransferase [Gracilibacillus sp. YIM 98692]
MVSAVELNIQPLYKRELAVYVQLLSELGEENPISLEEAETLFEKISNYPFYHIYTIKQHDEIIGSFTLIVIDNFAHGGLKFGVLENVVVHPDMQRMGIGKFMMQQALHIAKKNGCYKLILASNKQRKNAHAFYESLGFQQHGISYVTELVE